MTNKRKILLIIGASMLILVYAASELQVVYTIKGKGVIMSRSEFTLIRTIEGNLVSSLKDNIDNTIHSFDVTEFQRGDVVSFRLNEKLTDRTYVTSEDTLGFIVSNEEQRNLIELVGQLGILKAELEFFTTGQKPEDVMVAKEAKDLAKQELITQQKLMARTRNLIVDGVISEQEFEIEENRLKVAELRESIANANYLSVTTGDKPEMEKLVQARIEALTQQISQIQNRLGFFTIKSPISGRLSFRRNPAEPGTILTVTDTSALVGILPILLSEQPYLIVGGTANRMDQQGSIRHIDNFVQYIDSRQTIYVTTTWPYIDDVLVGSIQEIELHCDSVSVLGLLMRRFSNSAKG